MNNTNGEQGRFIVQTVTTKYSNSLITVLNVPVYEYETGELQLTRLTKVAMKKVLKSAFEKGITEIEFDKNIK